MKLNGCWHLNSVTFSDFSIFVPYRKHLALIRRNRLQQLCQLLPESTRWLGLKFRLDAQNLLDYDTTRERTIYTGSRDLSPVAYREMKFLKNGRRFLLTASGTF